jgi:uncharacterized membrane protein
MKNLLQTHEVSWAQGVKLALESEGIEAVVLDEHAPGFIGFAGRVRVAVVKDADLARAQSVLARLTPPIGPPPPSWHLQKRGLQLMGVGVLVIVLTSAFVDELEQRVLFFVSLGATALAFIGGFVLIALGWRADNKKPQP